MSKQSRSPLGLAALALLGALALLVPARSQEEPGESAPAPEGEFFESIDVSLVNVDVFVTDKRGNRIRGLTRDDFEVLEDKRPMAITHFFAVEDGRPVGLADPEEAETESAPPSPLPDRRAVVSEIPEDQRLHLVVYIDNWNIKPFNRNRVFTGIREFLRNQLSPGDRVMLMTFDREAHVRRPFTSDPTTIAAALFEIERMAANGVRLESDRRDVLRWIQDTDNAATAAARARTYAESLQNDLHFSINALRELVSSLAGLPGRKAILYVSDGIELVPGEDVYYALHEKFPNQSSLVLEARGFDLTRRFRELIAAANADRTSFYTIDAAGLRAPSGSDASEMRAGASAYADQVQWSNLQGSIRMMAERTGGLAIFNTNDPRRGLERVADDFRNYYSLGYAPARVGDGRYHTIEVRVKGRKDLDVRTRDGYRDKSVEARMADGVVAALKFDVESNPLGIEIERGRETARERGHFLVPISVRIPIGRLVLVPKEGVHVARVRLFFAALDEQGGMSEVSDARVPIEVPEGQLSEALKGMWRYDVPLLMRGGAQKLAVGLRDELGQVSSYAVRTIQVGG
jgi:VWFA-related protein